MELSRILSAQLVGLRTTQMADGAEVVVWIANPDRATDHPYVKAVMVASGDEAAVASDLGARCVVRPVGGGPEVQLYTSEVHPCNPPGHRSDNTQLLYLNEPCVIENIAHRYDELVPVAASATYSATTTATATATPIATASAASTLSPSRQAATPPPRSQTHPPPHPPAP